VGDIEGAIEDDWTLSRWKLEALTGCDRCGFFFFDPRAQQAIKIRIATTIVARMPPTIRVIKESGGFGIGSVGFSGKISCSTESLRRQIFLLEKTSSVTLFAARLSVTSMVIVTSTSAALTPEHCISTTKVSISCGISPILDILSCGRGRTTESVVAIFIRYGNGLPAKLCHVNAISRTFAGTGTVN
jgi:hypothetical protein